MRVKKLEEIPGHLIFRVAEQAANQLDNLTVVDLLSSREWIM
jgi:hypothetical protein